MILLFVVFFSIFSYENYLINGVWFFDHNTPPEYSYKADFNFLFNFDLIGYFLHHISIMLAILH